MSYFSVVPTDLIGLLISNMSLDQMLLLAQTDSSFLQKLKNNPFFLRKFEMKITTEEQVNLFSKLICDLKNQVTKNFLLSAIELNSPLLFEYGLRQGEEFTAFIGSDIGRSVNPYDFNTSSTSVENQKKIIDLAIEFMRPKGVDYVKLLENSIAIGAVQSGNIELFQKYLDQDIATPKNLFQNAIDFD